MLCLCTFSSVVTKLLEISSTVSYKTLLLDVTQLQANVTAAACSSCLAMMFGGVGCIIHTYHIIFKIYDELVS